MKKEYHLIIIFVLSIAVWIELSYSGKIIYESFPNYVITGKVVSCTYEWLNDDTTVTFSGQGSYVFHGNYNLQVGGNYTILYKQGFSGYEITSIIQN